MTNNYGFSSVYVPIQGELKEYILNFGDDQIPEESLFIDKEKDFYGREDEPHVTISYGLKCDSPESIMHILKDCNKFTIRLGEIDVFHRMNFDVIIIRAFSKKIHDLHHEIMKETDTKSTFKFYEPHVTLGYVKKGKCKDLLGNKDFEDVEVQVDKLIFSSKVGTKTTIKLGSKS